MDMELSWSNCVITWRNLFKVSLQTCLLYLVILSQKSQKHLPWKLIQILIIIIPTRLISLYRSVKKIIASINLVWETFVLA
jgi:hypothetical protein